MAIQRKRNIAGYYDEVGRFRPIRSPKFVGSPNRRATAKVKAKYSRAKAGDLGKQRQERALEDVFDREIRLAKEADEAKRRDRERLERSIEKDIYGEAGERSKGKTLMQFVRASGGIRLTKGDGGELGYLSQKESGKRGLITTRGGKSFDGMYQAARESGYNVRSMDDMLDRLIAEAKGGKPMYKTHGYLDYRDNPTELRVMQITPKSYGVFLRKYLLKRFRTKAAAEKYRDSIKARAKNPASAARLAKSAIAVFDTDLDLDLDTRDVRRLGVGAKRLRGKKRNPVDPVGLFANAAVGIASALQIKEYMNRPKTTVRRKAPARRKTNGKTTAKRRVGSAARTSVRANPARRAKTAAGPKSYFLMPFIDGVYLTDGESLGRRFKTQKAAREYASKMKIRLSNPPAKKANPIGVQEVKQYCERQLGRKLNLKSKEDLDFYKKQLALFRRLGTRSPKEIHETNRVFRKTGLKRGKSAKNNPRSAGGKKAAASSAKPNPKTTAKRRTFEMFQGRPATMVRPLPVSRFAPARMDQLGDLIEIKLADGQVIKPNPKRFKLCAAGGKLWIAGGTFAKANPAGRSNELNPIERVAHVVYGTRKPHHGDNAYTHYIHRLGEDSGHMPMLAVDREGFPVIRGGKYKIEARGIVN